MLLNASGLNMQQVRRVLLVAMPLLALAPKLWIISHALYPGDRSVFDTGFGFGGYIRSLVEDGQFRSCSFLPFAPCNAGTCTFATRMPGLPLLLAALAKLFGMQLATVALAKCLLMSTLCAGFLLVLSMDVQITTFGLVLLYGLYFGPQPLKHAAVLEYEEGVLIDLCVCLAVALVYLLRPQITSSRVRRLLMACAAVLIAAIMYFTKTTALLTLLVVLMLVLTTRSVHIRARLACLVAVVCLAGVWATHNVSSSGVFSLSSSWNGENLYRGYDSGALAIYPQISLDRIFDSKRAVLDDGSIIPLGAYRSSRCFRDEWTWSRTYSQMALQWLVAHPGAALQFYLKKTWVALLEVRHTPKYGSATDKSEEGSPTVRAIMIVWMVMARAAFFLLLVRIALDLRSGRNGRYMWVLVLLLAACAPYVIAFAYQRHVIPILELAGSLLAILYFARPATTPGCDFAKGSSDRHVAPQPST